MKRFTQLTEAEFDSFSRSFRPSNFLQSAAMGRSQTERGQTVYYYGLKDNDRVIAAGLFTIRPVRKIFRIATAIGGLLMDYSNKADLQLIRQGLIEAFGKKGVVKVSFNPPFTLVERDINGDIVAGGSDRHDWVDNLIGAGFNHHGYHNQYGTIDSRWFFVKDLRHINGPEELIMTFDTQNRWATRKTQKLGITVRDLSYDELERFVELMEHTSERRGFDNRDLEYFQSLYRQFNQQDELRVLVAELDLDRHEQELIHLKQEQEAELTEATERHAHRPTKKWPTGSGWRRKPSMVLNKSWPTWNNSELMDRSFYWPELYLSGLATQ